METLIAKYHLHPIIYHLTIALLVIGVLADVAGYAIKALLGNRSPRARTLSDRLRAAAPVLLVPGAISAIFSRLPAKARRSGSGTPSLRPRRRSSFPIPAPLRFFLTRCSGRT
jgi:hypothetical protein